MLGPLSSVLILSVVHILANRITYFGTLPRRKLLSLAGGISVAFVFTDILPELHKMQNLLEQNGSIPFPVESYLYVMALVGILFFYGIEKAIIRLQEKNASKEQVQIDDSIFSWHIGIFGSFNFVIGYYLHQNYGCLTWVPF